MTEVLPQLTDGQKEDARAALKRLTANVVLTRSLETIAKAKRKLIQIRAAESNTAILSSLTTADRLIEFIERHEGSSRAHERKLALAALEYLVDPWEVIPDLIPTHGFLDDIYVLELAAAAVGSHSATDAPISAAKRFIEQLPTGAGQHFAHRAMEQNLLGPSERALLSMISARQHTRAEIEDAICERFKSIASELVGLGMLNRPCRLQNCLACRKLGELVR